MCHPVPHPQLPYLRGYQVVADSGRAPGRRPRLTEIYGRPRASVDRSNGRAAEAAAGALLPDRTSAGGSARAALMSRTILRSVLSAAALALGGCWTAPNANVQPKGEPRLIQSGIGVQSVKKSAIVQSINAGTRTIVVLPSGEATASTYKVGAHVSNFDRIKAGDKVDVTIAEELAVYVLRGDQLPAPSGAPETIVATARVLSIDSSYRLLKVQYSGGRRETFKVGLEVDLREMQAGDSVVIRTGEAVALRVRKS